MLGGEVSLIAFVLDAPNWAALLANEVAAPTRGARVAIALKGGL